MISRLHYITQDIKGYTHDELAARACATGAGWVQLRMKNRSYRDWMDSAIKTEAVCRKYHAKLIINDNVTLAKTIRADGVHLGKNDMDPAEARNILGKNFIIGGTANTFEDIQRLVGAGIDYIGLGPFRFTATKEKLAPVLGLEGYKTIIKKCSEAGIAVPLIAIGGIKPEDIKPLMETGIYGIAVSSAVNLSDNPPEAVRRFLNKIKFMTEKSH